MCAGGAPFSLHGRVKAHARILWGIAWSSNNALFATAARDCTVKLCQTVTSYMHTESLKSI